MQKATKYWHKIDDKHIQCDLCPRFCRLKIGQRGFCYIRENQNQQLLLSSYGRSSGFAIDPIEKKPLYHFYPGSKIFSFGTAGCNLGCKFCQNWDTSKSRQMDIMMDKASPQQIALAALQENCASVAFTYNDPVIFHEYAIDTALACHQYQLKSVAVTAGYICAEPRMEFFSVMDAVNIDLKFFNEKSYYQLTGCHLKNILETILYIHQHTQVWMEITTLIIPGINDSEKELEELTDWIALELGLDVPLHFSAFHPDYKMKNIDRTPLSSLLKARAIAQKKGIRYVYTGNVRNMESSSTWCHHCNNLLIERDVYNTQLVGMDETGYCKQCHSRCSGYF